MNWERFLARVHLATVLILLVALVASVALIAGSITWAEYLSFCKWAFGLLAIGRGVLYTRVNPNG